jgi:hypothetical protein
MTSSKIPLPVPKDEYDAALKSIIDTLHSQSEITSKISPNNLQHLTSLLSSSFEKIDNFTLQPMDYNLYKKEFIKYDTPMKEKIGVLSSPANNTDNTEDDDDFSCSDDSSNSDDDSSVDTILEEEDLIDEEVWQRARVLRQQVREAACNTSTARAEQLHRLQTIVDSVTEQYKNIDEEAIEQMTSALSIPNGEEEEEEEGLSSTVKLENMKSSLSNLQILLNAMDVDLPNRLEDLKDNVEQAENALQVHRGEKTLSATEKAIQTKMGSGLKSIIKGGMESEEQTFNEENEINGVKKSAESRFAAFISRH